jgi:hypothetical protein
MNKFILTLFSLSLISSYSLATEIQKTTETHQINTFLGSVQVSKTSTTTFDNNKTKISIMVEFVNRKNHHSLAKFANVTTFGTAAQGEEHVIGYVKNDKGADVKSLLHYTFIPQLKDDGKISIDYLVATVPEEKTNGMKIDDILSQGNMIIETHKTYTINLNDYVAVKFSLQNQ